MRSQRARFQDDTTPPIFNNLPTRIIERSPDEVRQIQAPVHDATPLEAAEPEEVGTQPPVSLKMSIDQIMSDRDTRPEFASLTIAALEHRLHQANLHIASSAAERRLVTLSTSLLRSRAQAEIDRCRRTSEDSRRRHDDVKLALAMARMPRIIRWKIDKHLRAHRSFAQLPNVIDQLRRLADAAEDEELSLSSSNRDQLEQLIAEIDEAERRYERELAGRAHEITTHSATISECEETLGLRSDLILELARAGRVCEPTLKAAGPIPGRTSPRVMRRNVASDIEQLELHHERLLAHRTAEHEVDLRDEKTVSHDARFEYSISREHHLL